MEARKVAAEIFHCLASEDELLKKVVRNAELVRTKLLVRLAAVAQYKWADAGARDVKEVWQILQTILLIAQEDGHDALTFSEEEGTALSQALTELLSFLVEGNNQGSMPRRTKAYAAPRSTRAKWRPVKDDGYVVAEEPKTPEYQLLCRLVKDGENMHAFVKGGALEAHVLVAHNGVMSALEAIEMASKVDPWAVIDAGAHLAALSILSSFFLDDLTMKPISDQEKSSHLIVSSLRLLGSLSHVSSHDKTGQHNQKHRDVLMEAVTGNNASDGPDCVSLCAGLVSACAGALVVQESGDNEDIDKETKTGDAGALSPRVLQSEQICISALSFLAELLQDACCREILTEQAQLLQSVLTIVRHTSCLRLENAGVSFLNMITPFLSEDETRGEISKTLMTVLSKFEDMELPDELNGGDNKNGEHFRNGTLALTLNTLECFMDDPQVGDLENTDAVLEASLRHFLSLFEFNVEVDQHESDGKLVCSATTLFLCALGSPSGRKVLLVPEVVAALLRLGSATIGGIDSSTQDWHCARTQSFQILAALMRRPAGCELVTDTIVEMESGGYVIVSAMDAALAGTDFVASNAVHRIMQCI